MQAESNLQTILFTTILFSVVLKATLKAMFSPNTVKSPLMIMSIEGKSIVRQRGFLCLLPHYLLLRCVLNIVWCLFFSFAVQLVIFCVINGNNTLEAWRTIERTDSHATTKFVWHNRWQGAPRKEHNRKKNT